MYCDYKQQYPKCSFKETSLKDAVRKTLKELNTGNSNEKSSERACLQKDTVLQQLKLTDSHAKRNILAQRQAILSSASSVPLVPSPKEQNGPDKDVELARPSKAQALELQAKSIASFCCNYEKSTAARDTYLKRKTEQLERKAKRARLAELKEAKALGLIGEQQFEAEARKLLNV